MASQQVACEAKNFAWIDPILYPVGTFELTVPYARMLYISDLTWKNGMTILE